MVANSLTKPLVGDVYNSHVWVMGFYSYVLCISLDFNIFSVIYDSDIYFTSLQLCEHSGIVCMIGWTTLLSNIYLYC